LRELGWVDGKNIAVEYRWASGHQDRLSALAGDLVRLKVDVIVTASTPVAIAAKQATTTIPIVVTFVADPVGSGIVTSLANPGGNITGVTDNTADLMTKYLELLTQMVSRADRRAGPLGSGRTPGTYQTKYARGARRRRASAGSAAGIHGYTAVR
jgi:putative ABC transport system substrate-binding protein